MMVVICPVQMALCWPSVGPSMGDMTSQLAHKADLLPMTSAPFHGQQMSSAQSVYGSEIVISMQV